MNKSKNLSSRIESLIEDLEARIRSTKALYARPGTPGERDAAKSALDRMRAKHGDIHGLGKDHDNMMSHHMTNHGITPNQHSPGRSANSSQSSYKPETHWPARHGFYAKNDNKYHGPFSSKEGAEDFAYRKNHFKPHVVHHDASNDEWKETTGARPKKHKLAENPMFVSKKTDD